MYPRAGSSSLKREGHPTGDDDDEGRNATLLLESHDLDLSADFEYRASDGEDTAAAEEEHAVTDKEHASDDGVEAAGEDSSAAGILHGQPNPIILKLRSSNPSLRTFLGIPPDNGDEQQDAVLKSLVTKVSKSLLEQAQFVATTNTQCQSKFGLIAQNHTDICVGDEIAASTELQTLQVWKGNKRPFVCGVDDAQLPACVASEHANIEAGKPVSLFVDQMRYPLISRFANLGWPYWAMEEQLRMAPRIRTSNFAVTTRIQLANSHVDVVVVVPYLARMELYIEVTIRSPNLFQGPEVVTSTAYQDYEKHIVFYDLTAASNMENVGFVADMKCNTVAITRQKSGLIIFGDYACIKSCEFDELTSEDHGGSSEPPQDDPESAEAIKKLLAELDEDNHIDMGVEKDWNEQLEHVQHRFDWFVYRQRIHHQDADDLAHPFFIDPQIEDDNIEQLTAEYAEEFKPAPKFIGRRQAGNAQKLQIPPQSDGQSAAITTIHDEVNHPPSTTDLPNLEKGLTFEVDNPSYLSQERLLEIGNAVSMATQNANSFQTGETPAISIANMTRSPFNWNGTESVILPERTLPPPPSSYETFANRADQVQATTDGSQSFKHTQADDAELCLGEQSPYGFGGPLQFPLNPPGFSRHSRWAFDNPTTSLHTPGSPHHSGYGTSSKPPSPSPHLPGLEQSSGSSPSPTIASWTGQLLGMEQAPAFSQSSGFNQLPGPSQSPGFNQLPGPSQSPGMGQPPAFNQLPGPSQSPGMGQPPAFSQSRRDRPSAPSNLVRLAYRFLISGGVEGGSLTLDVPAELFQKVNGQIDEWVKSGKIIKWYQATTVGKTRCVEVISRGLTQVMGPSISDFGDKFACKHCKDRGCLCVLVGNDGPVVAPLSPSDRDVNAISGTVPYYLTK
ncbi:hypothetical protein NHQ30_009453 [Ciborinia camelliae]|nr:hypothetical protein NHQ30_009453 [Ciborinia camelliae]